MGPDEKRPEEEPEWELDAEGEPTVLTDPFEEDPPDDDGDDEIPF